MARIEKKSVETGMRKKETTLKTLDVKLYNAYNEGVMSLHECARMFYMHGWDNFVDEQATARRFALLNA